MLWVQYAGDLYMLFASFFNYDRNHMKHTQKFIYALRFVSQNEYKKEHALLWKQQKLLYIHMTTTMMIKKR